MSEEQNSGFKISDRRMFNPDGSLRDDQPFQEVEPATPASIFTRPEENSSTAAQPAREATPLFNKPVPEEISEPDEEPEMTEFMQFLYSFASSTSFIHLGLIEHPATGRPEVNLQAAQQGIAMLMLLREKTKGNLTPTEDEFFESLLADLQMQFVSLRNQKPAGRP